CGLVILGVVRAALPAVVLASSSPPPHPALRNSVTGSNGNFHAGRHRQLPVVTTGAIVDQRCFRSKSSPRHKPTDLATPAARRVQYTLGAVSPKLRGRPAVTQTMQRDLFTPEETPAQPAAGLFADVV